MSATKEAQQSSAIDPNDIILFKYKQHQESYDKATSSSDEKCVQSKDLSI